ncbi:hypothetical protein [Enterovirga rhinocerotis]|uniref:Uncharacterized protein n=1 Tax=Enterovirga rhinocerotis TaxID=1339210 RepID=A0A4R7C178_9HYPH|nr:hypothetical protein [Enterovirga rhinocerotis]TDR90136.1 hypothetical protein EV668_2978 [Enterovirga rhinocerotis]
MTIALKTERSLLSQDEFATLAQTHYPALYEVDGAALPDLRQRIRTLRDKERTLARTLRRSIRGKAGERGGSFPGNIEKPARRKQVFAGALKRLNKEADRRRVMEAREALRGAVAAKQAADGTGAPDPGRTGRTGMRPQESARRRTAVNRAKVGSVSQATRNAQARRDAR